MADFRKVMQGFEVRLHRDEIVSIREAWKLDAGRQEISGKRYSRAVHGILADDSAVRIRRRFAPPSGHCIAKATDRAGAD